MASAAFPSLSRTTPNPQWASAVWGLSRLGPQPHGGGEVLLGRNDLAMLSRGTPGGPAYAPAQACASWQIGARSRTRRSNMVKSWTSKRWMMALGISCGLLGLVLKLSGMPGSGESTAPAAPHGPSRAGRDASRPTGSRGEPAQVASGAGERGSEGDRAHADTTPSGLKRVGPSDVGNETGGYRLGNLTPRALRRLARIRGKKGPRSLRGAKTESAATASGLTDGDSAFTSGSGVQYTTDSQVEIADIGKITGPAGTMSFWLQPGSGAANQDAAT